MRSHWVILALVFGWGFGWCVTWSSATGVAISPDDLAKLITQLGSSRFSEREQATQALDALGGPALMALREATKSDDIEVSRRAESLVQKIEKRAERDRILAATPLQLKYRDVPLAKAVADLAKKTGYAIVLKDDAGQLATRTVTVDTGLTTFWQALDQFCQAAGLVELGASNPRVPPPPPGRPGPALPRVIPVPAAAAVATSRSNPVVPGKGLIVLGEGRPEYVATYYAGSVRFRIVPLAAALLPADRSAGLLPLLLEVAPEPRHEWFTPGEVRVEQCVADNGQELSPVSEITAAANARVGVLRRVSFSSATPRQTGGHQLLPIWLATPQRSPKGLKELRGQITAQVQLGPRPLLSVEPILQAVGQTTRGAEGGYLKVLEAARQDDGQVKVRVEMQYPPQVIPGVGPQGFFAGAAGGVIQIQAAQIQLLPAGQPLPMPVPVPARPVGAVPFAGWSYLGLSLEDGQGKAFQLTAVPQQQTRINGPTMTRDVTVVFKPLSGQGEARKLVFSGSRAATLEVPFAFTDVSLP